VIGRLVSTADFERVLRTPPRARTTHFAVHHLAAGPIGRAAAVAQKLSTDGAPQQPNPVDDSASRPVAGLWLGSVVPKRHARRSVTRTLLKRQIRRSAEACTAHLDAGLWVVRLRAPFERSEFRSAASLALRQAAGAELATLMATAMQRSRRAGVSS
jgi:ribonuclease P protein component